MKKQFKEVIAKLEDIGKFILANELSEVMSDSSELKRIKTPSILKSLINGKIKGAYLREAINPLTKTEMRTLIIVMNDFSFYGDSLISDMQKFISNGLRMFFIDDGSFNAKGKPVMIFDATKAGV